MGMWAPVVGTCSFISENLGRGLGGKGEVG